LAKSHISTKEFHKISRSVFRNSREQPNNETAANQCRKLNYISRWRWSQSTILSIENYR